MSAVRTTRSTNQLELRPYSAADLDRVVQVFTDAIHVLAARAYDDAQRAAWAPRPPDISAWRKRVHGLQTWLAVDGDLVVGFVFYETNGHIDLLYASPSHARRGVASALYERAETDLASSGAVALIVEAREVARPFFERCGFVAAEEQEVSRSGVSFRRFIMRKQLVAENRGAAAARPAAANRATTEP